MGLRNQINRPGRPPDHAQQQEGTASDFEETVWAPSRGAYLTDEIALFRVQDAISNRGQLFLELENCATLELILCPAPTVARLGLRAVTPTLSA